MAERSRCAARQGFMAIASVHDGGVVPAAQDLADPVKAQALAAGLVKQAAHPMHDLVSRPCDRRPLTFTLELRHREAMLEGGRGEDEPDLVAPRDRLHYSATP